MNWRDGEPRLTVGGKELTADEICYRSPDVT